LTTIPTSWYGAFNQKENPLPAASSDSKQRFLDAALSVIRAKGYTATRVEDVCDAAGLTKGSFFHHFEGKEDLALSAAAYWHEMTGSLFASAAYRALPGPVERLLGYIDLRKALLLGELKDFTCLIGTMVQEVYATHPPIREACEKNIWEHAETLEADIAKAMLAREAAEGTRLPFTAHSLALHTQAVIQGAFVLAKAHGGAEVAGESIDHLRRYFEMLFVPSSMKGKP
jgi:TetR/AcrR family transcriptional repressor of nem operon